MRKKIVVPAEMEFSRAVSNAKGCYVVSSNPKRGYFVVECNDLSSLEALYQLGCEIIDDNRYSIESGERQLR